MASRADAISQLEKKVETYSDFPNSFSKHPITDELVVIKNEASLRQAFKNLILTNIGERAFNPFFGSNIKRTLFEPFGPFVREDIIRYVRDSAKAFESRIDVLGIEVKDNQDKNGIEVNIVFSIINNPEPVSLNIFLKRVR